MNSRQPLQRASDAEPDPNPDRPLSQVQADVSSNSIKLLSQGYLINDSRRRNLS